MRNILSLRCDRDGNWNPHYIYFCNNFIRCIVGLQTYKRQWRLDHAQLSNIATESDEAMALLLFENNENKWTDEYYKLHEGRQMLQQEGMLGNDTTSIHKNTTSTSSSSIKTKYTSAGDNSNKKGFTKKYGGWSNAGINRYNTLVEMVTQDRERHGLAFDIHFRKEILKQSDKQIEGISITTNNSHDNHVVKEPPVRAVNNLSKILGLIPSFSTRKNNNIFANEENVQQEQMEEEENGEECWHQSTAV